MVGTITPPPAVNGKVEKTHVSSKDPHHEINKDKKEKDKNKRDNNPKDKVVLSNKESHEPSTHSGDKDKYPDSPMQGHIDISV